MRKMISAIACAGCLVLAGPQILIAEDMQELKTDVTKDHVGKAKSSNKPSPWKPRIFVPKLKFQASDRTAALEAIQFALVEVADGSTFVWHRPDSSLSGRVSPTETFRDNSGQICRHLKFSLSARQLTRQIEGIACRDGKGIWSLAG